MGLSAGSSHICPLPPPNLYDRSLAWANPAHPTGFHEVKPGYEVFGTSKETVRE